MNCIQIIGKINNNNNWQQQMNFAEELLLDAWQKTNPDHNIIIINPAEWSENHPLHTPSIGTLLSLAQNIATHYSVNISQSDAHYIVYSLIYLTMISDGIFVLPTAEQSFGSAAEIMVARRRKLPPIFLLDVDKQSFSNTLSAYIVLKSTDDTIKLLFEPVAGKLIVGQQGDNTSIDISHIIAITQTDAKQLILNDNIDNVVKDIIDKQYLFIYQPTYVSYILHWNLPEFFQLTQQSDEKRI